jgi:hypothetical protein
MEDQIVQSGIVDNFKTFIFDKNKKFINIELAGKKSGIICTQK